MPPRKTLPHLGLVCQTSDETIRFRTITRTRLEHLGSDGRAALAALYVHNLDVLERALTYCDANAIRLFRIPSGIFPMADLPIGVEVLRDIRRHARAIGKRAEVLQIRLVAHPEQYVVLNSENAKVVVNAKAALKGQARVFDVLGLPRTTWAAINIHGGKSGRGKELAENIKRLPQAVRARLVLENDEYGYGAPEIYEVCVAAGVPMVFDAHHHLIRERLESYDHPSIARWLNRARATWPNPAWQLTHISNGRNAVGDARHSDLVTRMPAAFARVPWIEVEAKSKELAILELRRREPDRWA